MSKRCFIGRNALSNQKVFLSLKDLKKHWLVLGGTGRGKSKLIEHRARRHIRNGDGLLVLDPHGALYHDLVAYATRYCRKEDLVLIDLNDPDYAVSLNFCEGDYADVTALADQIISAIMKVFGDESQETKPRLERWLRNLLVALIQARLTLADMLDFLSPTARMFREAVLTSVSNRYVVQEWQAYDAITKRAEREALLEGPLNRAAKLNLPDQVRRVLGQQTSSVSVEDVIESGKIVLCNLAPLRVSKECQRIVSILLVDRIINYAKHRTPRQARRPFYVIADEAAELTSSDVPYALQAMRKFGIFFTLCFQSLVQLNHIDGYRENVMTNCDVKIAFKLSRGDAEQMVDELFAGQLRGDRVKHEIKRTMLIPRETTREVVAESESESESKGEVLSSSETYGSGDVSVESTGFGESFTEHDPLGPASSLSLAQSSHSGSASAVSFNDSHSTGYSEISSSTKSTARGKSVVPFYEYMRELELSSRQYYSIEELREKYIAWVMCQPPRHVQVKLGDERAIPLITAFVSGVPVREKDMQKTVARSNAKYALPSHEVDRLIEARRERLLSVAHERVAQANQEMEANRWQ